jgi:hypothetical protein
VLGTVPADLILLLLVLLRMLSILDMVVAVVLVLALDLLSCGRRILAAVMRGREAELLLMVSSCDTWLTVPGCWPPAPADVLGSNEDVAGLLAIEEVPENLDRPAFPSFSASVATLKRTDLALRTVRKPSLDAAFCPSFCIEASAAPPVLLGKGGMHNAALQLAASTGQQFDTSYSTHNSALG